MTKLVIDLSDVAGGTHPEDTVVVWSPVHREGSAGRTVSPTQHTIRLAEGVGEREVEPGPLMVQTHVRAIADTRPKEVVVPDHDEITLWELLEQRFTYTPPVVSSVSQDRAAAEDAADRAESGADRVGTAEQVETWAANAKISETNAGTAASDALTIKNSIPQTVATEVDTQVPPAVAEAIAQDSTVTDAATTAINTAMDQAGTRIPGIHEGTDYAAVIGDGDHAALAVTTDGEVEIPKFGESTLDALQKRMGTDSLVQGVGGVDVYPWRVTDEAGAVPLAIRQDGAVDFRRLTPEALSYLAENISGASTKPSWVPETDTRATYFPTGESVTVPAATGFTTFGDGLVWQEDGQSMWMKTPDDGPWMVAPTIKAAIWGSSTTARLNSHLQSALAAQGVTDYHFGGYSGDSAEEIMWRAGYWPVYLGASVIVPTTGAVEITIAGGVPPEVDLVRAESMSGELAGIPGVILLSSGVVTFTRVTDGDAVSVPSGAEFVPTGERYRDAISIINMGKNNISGSAGDGAHAAARTDEFASWLRTLTGRHLVMSHFSNWLWADGDPRFAETADANARMQATYGERFLDLNAYILGSEIWSHTGVTPTAQDLDDQARGVVPHSLSADGAHTDGPASSAVVNHLIIPALQAKGWL